MSSSQDPIQGQQVVLSGQVFTPADHAVFGGQLGKAGFTSTEISELMGAIEREAMTAAMNAGRQVALAAVNRIVQTISLTHYNTAMEIYRRLSNKNGGTGGIIGHRACCQIAFDVANSLPTHAPAAASPIIGSPR
jgi:PIN domain nuclease of toxin-antitoxin system